LHVKTFENTDVISEIETFWSLLEYLIQKEIFET